jgi:hypothetical protein
MTTKKNKSPSKKPSKGKRPKKASAGHPRATNPSVPKGMALVPSSVFGHGPRRRPHHGRKGRRVPHKSNPGNPPDGTPPSHLHSALAAIGFGLAAATTGMLGGWALSKAGLQSNGANAAANLAAGTLLGGGVGLADRAAGTILAHNYYVAAAQWLMANSPKTTSAPTTVRHVQTAMPPRVTGAPVAALPAKPMHGLDDVGSYEHLDGVVADNMGDPDEMGAYEHLDGVVADNMGEAEIEGFDVDGVDDGFGAPDLFD